MTRDAMRPASAGHHSCRNVDDSDLLVGLWEEARFARLPWDAPSELKDLVEDVDNPKRVYAIHKASRRHNFQLLVQKYIVQLREGCGADHCTTSTCFTCRKRVAGRAPVRRYNTTSARTLALYLASQDNPELGLCPNLRPSRAPPAALSSLVFVPNAKPRAREDRIHPTSPKAQAFHTGSNSPKTNNGHVVQPTPTRRDSLTASGRMNGRTQPTSAQSSEAAKQSRPPGFAAVEEPVSKDHRSFAANVFGTVAFKMLEWLHPAAIEDMSQRTRRFRGDPDPQYEEGELPPAQPRASSVRPRLPQDSPVLTAEPKSDLVNERAPNGQAQTPKEVPGPIDTQQHEPPPSPRAINTRRNSNAKVRTSSGPKPKRQLSIDPFVQEPSVEEPYAALLRSPRVIAGSADKPPRGPKTTGSNLTRPISQLSSAGFFDDVSLEKMPSLKNTDLKPRKSRGQLNGVGSAGSSSPKELGTASGVSSNRSCSNESTVAASHDLDLETDNLLPQSLSKLNATVVDFMCDVIQEDGTAEKHVLEPRRIIKFHHRKTGQGKLVRRKRRSARDDSVNVRLEWKLFVEQTLFYVLSDPQLALRSFTKQGQLYDSHTLWYCMLRMTRIAPSLVFHSLWMAAASLFAPPKALQSLRSPTTKVFPKDEPALSNLEAGRLISICLHALIAAAPPVSDSQQLYDMSRIRAHGLSLAGSGAVARQPAELCLRYEEAFTDDMALRLARRLFSALSTRRSFDELSQSNTAGDETPEEDVLAPLFSQLDFLNMDAVYILNFSFPERALHETRVPILLLDWARAVMMNEWDGSPEVAGDGSFGGALALVEAMYKRRHELLLPDAQFRFDYLAERLDTIKMPVSWLSHTATRHRLHLLDFPYLFSSATLVSCFRSINLSRMSRAYEEASSLHGKIAVFSHQGGLQQHHKSFLDELLPASGAKYLTLGIQRGNVLGDAFKQLWRRQQRELLRPLKVHLGESNGEEGFDSGGVQQEFFRMAIAEALNPDYGAFTVDDRTRMAWFLPGSPVYEWDFELIGLLVSLAVYNGLTLPVTFPKALYRKLLGEPVTELHHIADGWPDLANGLTSLLEWDEKDGLVEDVFARTYEFSVSTLGHHITREMKTQPDNSGHSHNHHGQDEEWPQFVEAPSEQQPPSESDPANARSTDDAATTTTVANAIDEAPLVTSANRNAYVSDYIRYLTDVSIRPQYEAFARGFHTCLHPKSLTLLTPPLLQSLVEGVQEIDVAELKRYVRYIGWDASHRTVRDFWSVVRRYDDGMRRRLLEFVTASDRLPVGGVKNLQFVVQRNGEEEDPHGRLPTAYTCYGTLLLPEYASKEVLRERLAMALENAQGFGFA